MLEEYRDYFDAPTEADIVIAEAQEKLRDLFSDVTKATCEKARNAEHELSRLQGEITAAQYKLEGTEKAFAEMCQRMESYERHDFPRKVLQDMVHEATGDICPGDTVYILDTTYHMETCQFCGGHGTIEVTDSRGNALSIDCMKCNGRKRIAIRVFKPTQEKVKSVNLKLCFHENRVNYWNTDCIYMGLLGENAYSVKDVFKTLEEAQARADELNKAGI